MRREKQTSKDFYKHSETGEIFCIENRWDGVLIGIGRAGCVVSVRCFHSPIVPGFRF